jgi:hypothetical protein
MTRPIFVSSVIQIKIAVEQSRAFTLLSMYYSPYKGELYLRGYGSCSKNGKCTVKFFSKNLEK